MSFSNNKQVAQWVKNLPATQEIQVRSLGQEDPLKEGTATHSSILAWRIPWTEEPGGLPSMNLRVGPEWSDWAHAHTTTNSLFFPVLCHPKAPTQQVEIRFLWLGGTLALISLKDLVKPTQGWFHHSHSGYSLPTLFIVIESPKWPLSLKLPWLSGFHKDLCLLSLNKGKRRVWGKDKAEQFQLTWVWEGPTAPGGSGWSPSTTAPRDHTPESSRQTALWGRERKETTVFPVIRWDPISKKGRGRHGGANSI